MASSSLCRLDRPAYNSTWLKITSTNADVMRRRTSSIQPRVQPRGSPMCQKMDPGRRKLVMPAHQGVVKNTREPAWRGDKVHVFNPPGGVPPAAFEFVQEPITVGSASNESSKTTSALSARAASCPPRFSP